MAQTYEELLKRRHEFADALVELLGAFRDIAGPMIDPVTEEPCTHDRDEVCECGIPPGAIVTQFVLLTDWSDFSKPGTDGSWSHAAMTPGMTSSQKKGLLFTHLYG